MSAWNFFVVHRERCDNVDSGLLVVLEQRVEGGWWGGEGVRERDTMTLTLTYLNEQANSPFQWGNKRLAEPKIYIQ